MNQLYIAIFTIGALLYAWLLPTRWRQWTLLVASVIAVYRLQPALFVRYLEARHADGEMVGMGPQDYSSMVADSPVDTRMIEWRDPSGKLVACCLTDWNRDGISAVYSFYETARPDLSLGVYVVLWLIEEARRRDLPFVYLGYWVENGRKMAYKSGFRPLEGYGPEGWQRLE